MSVLNPFIPLKRKRLNGYPPRWPLLISHLKRARGLILVLGVSNVGKTTLCRYLIEKFFNARYQICFIDGDMGQSSIGPPTAMDLVRITRPSQSYFGSAISRQMAFVGSTSPQGHSLETLMGLTKLVALAQRANPDMIIVDTTSFINGPEAEELKYYKIGLLKPRHIIALQWKGEIEHLLQPHRHNRTIRIHRLTHQMP